MYVVCTDDIVERSFQKVYGRHAKWVEAIEGVK